MTSSSPSPLKCPTTRLPTPSTPPDDRVPWLQHVARGFPPSAVDSFIDAALDGGAPPLKPLAKSYWGYGGVVQAPDGAIWKVAVSRELRRHWA